MKSWLAGWSIPRGVAVVSFFLLGSLGAVAGRATAPQDEKQDEEPAEQRSELEALEDELRAAQERVEQARQRAREETEEALEEARRVREESVRDARRAVREARRHRRHLDNQVSIGSSVHVLPGEIADDVVAIGGAVTIDGEVDGDAVAVAGSITVNGVVRGNVTAVAGTVRLAPSAEIHGDVTSVGGKVHRPPGVRIDGHVSEVSLGSGFNLDAGDWFGGFRFFPRVARLGEYLEFAWDLVGILFLFLIGALITLLVPAQLAEVKTTISVSPWKAGLVCFAVELLFLPLLIVTFVLLCISIIGIPVAILGLPVVVLLAIVVLLFGFTASARAMGEFLKDRFNLRAASPYAILLLGLLALEGTELLGSALDLLPGGFLWPIRWLIALMGFLVLFLAWTIGLGAVCLRIFERRRLARPPELPVPIEDQTAPSY